jgi:DNA repair and recombination protein RAD54B
MFKPFKPFKPPLLRKLEKQESIDLAESDPEDDVQNHHPRKKRRLIHVVQDSPPKKLPTSSAAASVPRKPLLAIKSPNDAKSSESAISKCPEGYYMVLWYADSITARD